MTQQDKLQTLITKAIDGGYILVYPFTQSTHLGIDNANHRVFFGDCTESTALLFDHDFARALFGEDQHWPDINELNDKEWQYHLQQAVIADDPVDYMYNAVQ